MHHCISEDARAMPYSWSQMFLTLRKCLKGKSHHLIQKAENLVKHCYDTPQGKPKTRSVYPKSRALSEDEGLEDGG